MRVVEYEALRLSMRPLSMESITVQRRALLDAEEGRSNATTVSGHGGCHRYCRRSLCEPADLI